VVGGLLGILPEDERLNYSLDLAAKAHFPYTIEVATETPERYHPNTVVIEFEGDGKRLRVRGASVGGGNILIQSINGYPVDLTGTSDAILVLHHDEVGVIAIVSHVLAANKINIAGAVSHRKEKNEDALLVIEIDDSVPKAILDQLRSLPPVYEVVYVPKIAS
jgi:L-serine dehydratase